MAVSVLLTLRASAKSFAPTSLMLFPETLPTRRAQACQRLLTLCLIRKVRASGGVLDARQRAVDHEGLGEALRALGIDLAVAEAASSQGRANCQWLLTLSQIRQVGAWRGLLER